MLIRIFSFYNNINIATYLLLFLDITILYSPILYIAPYFMAHGSSAYGTLKTHHVTRGNPERTKG